MSLFEGYFDTAGDGAGLKRSLWQFFEDSDSSLPHYGAYYSRHNPLIALSDASIHEADCDIEVSRVELILALEMYHIKYDCYPETLDDLVPDILQNLPVDPFVEQSFVYKRAGDRYKLSLSEEAGQEMKRLKERWKITLTC